MLGPHHADAVGAGVHEQFVEGDILLRVGLEQVVILQAGDRQHWLIIELGVVNSVEQVDSARSRGGDAHAQLAGPFGVSAGCESSGFLMPHLDEADLLLARAKGLEDPIDAVAGYSEHDLDAPVDQGLDEDLASSLRHCRSLLASALNAQAWQWLDEPFRRASAPAPQNRFMPRHV